MIEYPNRLAPPSRWVAIIGSRGYPDREARVLSAVRSYADGVTGIVTGTLPDWTRPRDKWGVDEWAVIHALAVGLSVRVHPVERGPGTFGQRAAARNKLIVRDAVAVEALWDGESRGTKMTLGFARDAGKAWRIRLPDGRVKASEGWLDVLAGRSVG